MSTETTPKFTETKNNGKRHLIFDSYDEKGYGGGYTCFYSVVGNCKMTFIESVNGLSMGTDEQRKAKMDYVLSESDIIVSLNTNHEGFAKWIKDTYELYAYNEVPIGYNKGYQYHIIIRNTLSRRSNANLMRPIEPKKVTYKKDLGIIVTDILKKYRRKTDVATEIAQVIQDNTEG